MQIKFRDPVDQVWWDGLTRTEKQKVKKAYQCYDELSNTPLVDDLPDTVVTTIRNDRTLYDKLRHAHHELERKQVLSDALYIIGAGWLQFNEISPHSAPWQHLRGWLKLRERDDLLAHCARAVEREYERMQKEA